MKRLLLLAALLLIAGCADSVDSGTAAGSLVTPSSTSSSANSQSIPEAKLLNLATNQVTSSEAFAGKAYIINFWASWCTTCREEYPILADQSLTTNLIGINVQDASVGKYQQRAARNLLKENGITFENYVDVNEVFTKSLAISGLPVTIVVDKNGNIIDRHNGVLSKAILAEFNNKVGTSK